MMKSKKSFRLSAFAFGTMVILALCGMVFTSCQNEPENSGNDAKTNLPESKGQNEVSGRAAEIGSGTEIIFNDDGTAVLKEKSASGFGNVYSSNREATSSAGGSVSNPLSYFEYTFDSENKTVHLQLKERVKNGKKYSSTAYQDFLRTQIENAEKALISSVSDESIYSFFQGTDPNLGSAIKKTVVAKTESYIQEQEKLYSEYIETLYKSTTDFQYEISETGGLSLKMKRISDLGNVYAFYSDSETSATFCLNDRNYLCPLTLISEGSLYAGIPEYKPESESKGSASVYLYPVFATYSSEKSSFDYDKGVTNFTTSVTSLISGLMSQAGASAESDLEKIIAEFKTSNYEKSETLEKTLDYIVAGKTMTFSYEFSEEEAASLSVNVKLPDGITFSSSSLKLTQNNYFANFADYN